MNKPVRGRPKKGKKVFDSQSPSWKIEDVPDVMPDIIDEEHEDVFTVDEDDNDGIEGEIMAEEEKEYIAPDWFHRKQENLVVEARTLPQHEEQLSQQVVVDNKQYDDIIHQQDVRIQQLSESFASTINDMRLQQQKMQEELRASQEATMEALKQLVVATHNQDATNYMPSNALPDMPIERSGEKIVASGEPGMFRETLREFLPVIQQFAPLVLAHFQSKAAVPEPFDPLAALARITDGLKVYAGVTETMVGSLNLLNKQKNPFDEDAMVEKITEGVFRALNKGGQDG